MADPEAVDRYMQSQSKKKRESLVPHIIDEAYSSIFEDFPPCSGVALGFERLMMVLCGKKSIEDVMIFPFSSFFG